MARKNKESLTSRFDTVADADIKPKETNNNNVDSKHENNSDYLDNIIQGKQEEKKEPIFTGLYLDPDVSRVLNILADKIGKKGGGKSRIANEALRKVFKDKGQL